MNSRMAGLVAAVLLIGAWAGEALTDTTWVSGEVSGVWNAGGNPTGQGDVYIIEDSTWVADGDSLVLRGGAEIFFEENQGLYIFGNLSTVGTGHEGWSEYSVRIRVLDGVEHWRGIRFYGQHETNLDYLRVVVPDTLFFLDDGYTFTLTRSIMDSVYKAFCGYREAHPDHPQYTGVAWNLNFDNCIIDGGMELALWGSTIIADSSFFDFRHGDPSMAIGFTLAGPGTRAVFTYTSVYGGLRCGGWTIVEDCRFLALPDGFGEIYVTMDGICRRTFIDGGAGIGTTESIEDVTVTDVFAPTAPDNFGVELVRCVIGEHLLISDETTIRNSIIYGDLGMNGAGPVVFNSCYVGVGHPGEGPIANQIYIAEGCNVLFKHCLIESEIGVASAPNDETPRIFDHNTFVLEDGNGPLYSCLLNNSATFTNNVMINLRPVQVPVIKYQVGLTETIFQYNCVWGFDGYMQSYVPDTMIVIPPTNLTVNPEVTRDGISWLLNPNSPCIDAGNPDSTMDPDGTRNDIGYRFFYQMNRSIAPETELSAPSNLSFSSFPSPFNSSLSISYSSPTNAPLLISLVDLSGRTLQSNWFPGTTFGKRVATIGTTELPSGNYFVIVGGKDGAVMPVRCLK